MEHAYRNSLGARSILETKEGTLTWFRLERIEETGLGDISHLPFSIRILLESLLRNEDGCLVTFEDVQRLARYDPHVRATEEIPFLPGRVLLQDFTGVPALVDLAAMRQALARAGLDPAILEPEVPVDLVVDHSLQVDAFGSPAAQAENLRFEFQRNRERYTFLRWGQQAFQKLRILPPGSGICHQVNLEMLASVVTLRDGVLFPDSLVGTDSHTTMVNGLGVLGWGVGGIEAEAATLLQPLFMPPPPVVGVRLKGKLSPGVNATDLVLFVTELLRKVGVVERFVEFFGPSLAELSVPDRATVANMAPEYGATMGFFPVDDRVLEYLRRTGRSEAHVQRVERYCKAQGLFRTSGTPDPDFERVVELDLDEVERSMAGPGRPQDRVALPKLKATFDRLLHTSANQGGLAPDQAQEATGPKTEKRRSPNRAHTVAVRLPSGERFRLAHGLVAIAAITSCTNTSNPSVLVAAGLLAQNARRRGLMRKPWVKTSFAPGSTLVTDYLARLGLLAELEALGFFVVGYGCTTCIGNSGPLIPEVADAIESGGLVAAAVLSGNRNFEGRIHPLTKAAWLASPPLVVAYALAGTVNLDLASEPLGTDPSGNPVFLKEIWPSDQEVARLAEAAFDPEDAASRYATIEASNTTWNALPVPSGEVFAWDPASTYIREPPFFREMENVANIRPILAARVLVMLGDSVTTDHISPAGNIRSDSPAGRWLMAEGLSPEDFNSYGSRRGNDQVMVRGTFANGRLRNQLAPDRTGGFTKHLPSGDVLSIYEAAVRYRQEGTPLVVLAGRDYGMGSSRDWAAKGVRMLGVRAVIARSFERIHRSNLVGMGVFPLQFLDDQDAASLGLDGTETYFIHVPPELAPRSRVRVTVERADGSCIGFDLLVRADTPVEVAYLRDGGILRTVLAGIEREATTVGQRP
jgi:aconitate hydratase